MTEHTDQQPTLDQTSPQPASETGGQFVWHPDYAGQRVDQVQAELANQIESDQRTYRLAMEGAETSESDALESVVTLERRWGPYDFGWAELDATDLAARIVDFERERERRHEMISWAEYRELDDDAHLNDAGETPAGELSTGVKAAALILVALLIVLILLVVWAL